MRTAAAIATAVLLAGCFFSSRPPAPSSPVLPDFAVAFEGKRGQLQVGGPFVGAEFHHSRPFPSRISFYAPVANSIDLSTDYWKRDASRPFHVSLTVDGETESLDQTSFEYRSTPARVEFSRETPRYGANISYRFGERLPIMAVSIVLTNRESRTQEVSLATNMSASLRTSHAYTVKDVAWTRYSDNGSVFVADYDDAATDSAEVFVVNDGIAPSTWGITNPTAREVKHNPAAAFTYRQLLGPGQSIEVVQLIGSCRQSDCHKVLPDSIGAWRTDVATYEDRVNTYALNDALFNVNDSALSQTMHWSKALLQANRHFIDGHIAPMPCPAQYNFFFTHDLLVTDLGAVMFDTERVKRDLDYVRFLARGDSVLPHAYYWREDGFKTEFANSDNWNHLWLVVLAASYLKHSGDRETVEASLPMIRESLRIMLENERDGLMSASRPDWWDIGNVYGARAYITTLTIRALRSFLYIASELGIANAQTEDYARLARRMNEQLVERLWDDEAGYLLNMLDDRTVDRHYYSGSLLAAAYDLLDDDRKRVLLATARDQLLDANIGIRNAMPPDFHNLTDEYRFNGPEVGAPYKYMNGGVWPQGIAWYILGLLSAGQPEEAAGATRAWFTLDGIRKSPNGQPAFFEYREADPNADTYGQIDKTAFLWAGGWYLHVLYQLAGVRENAWNLSFDAGTPAGFEDVEYDLMVSGRRARVRWTGTGQTFRRIAVDGRPAASAVLVGPASRVMLERGLPDSPYLATATARVTRADYSEADRVLSVEANGVTGQQATYSVISPWPIRNIDVEGGFTPEVSEAQLAEGVYRVTFRTDFQSGRSPGSNTAVAMRFTY